MGRMGIHIAAIVAIAVATASARATVVVPDGLQAGDMYHLVFVTEGTRDATSIDIADYNAFVQAEAERSGATTENFGIDWFAIGSTAMVDARDNAVVEAPVYLLDGTRVSDGQTFVSGSYEIFLPLLAPIEFDQFAART